MASKELALSGDSFALPGFTGKVLEGEVVDPSALAAGDWKVNRCDNSGPNCPEFGVLPTGHLALRSTLFPETAAIMHPDELPALYDAVGKLMAQAGMVAGPQAV